MRTTAAVIIGTVVTALLFGCALSMKTSQSLDLQPGQLHFHRAPAKQPQP